MFSITLHNGLTNDLPPGPWKDEPDLALWTSEDGILCLVARMSSMGHLCGYIFVPEGHPWYRVGYDDIDCEVHGGLTYASEHEVSGKVMWRIGFDCAHVFDLSPFMAKLSLRTTLMGESDEDDGMGRDIYRNMAYTKAETERLAKQAIAAASANPTPTTEE